MQSNVVQLAATSTRNYGKNTFIPKPFEHIYTCNNGDLIPAFATIQINPGDTWKITTSIMARLNTSRYPTIARGWIDYSWFYVPHTQVWDNWDAFMGENKESAWVSQTAYSVPKVSIGANEITNGHLLEHFGWPTKQTNFKAGALKLRAYNWICDQFYRDQNIEAPFAPLTGDADIVYNPNGDHTVGAKPYQINRKADYFSTALPEPQKGPDVIIPLGVSANLSGTSTVRYDDTNAAVVLGRGLVSDGSVKIQVASGGTNSGERSSVQILNGNGNSTVGDGFGEYKQSTLEVDLSSGTANLQGASTTDINTLRDLVTTQHIYERDARSGTRAPEMLWARWGVEVDPLELGRPRMLNSGQFDISTNQVPQTSASTADSEQGTLTAFGYTNNRSDQETHSFKYAGTLMCLVAVRYEHKYQQGIPREDMKFDRFDFWHPEMAGLGDQPIYNYEIYATGGENGTMATESIFGYAERGAEYKNYPSMVTGQVRSNYEQTLDYVHMADDYASLPTLSPGWMKENPDNLDRTIFVTSNVTDQFIVDFVAEFEITSTLPLYSVPGIDRL